MQDSGWQLYWCETGDHDEDWFVVARSDEEAARFHENAEGYDEDDAWAEEVCAVPAPACAGLEEAGWPSEELLLACGAEFLPNTPHDGGDDLRRSMGSRARVVEMVVDGIDRRATHVGPVVPELHAWRTLGEGLQAPKGLGNCIVDARRRPALCPPACGLVDLPRGPRAYDDREALHRARRRAVRCSRNCSQVTSRPAR